MISYFLLIPFLSLLIVLLSKIAPSLKLIDKPDNRKFHKGQIPVIGGLAIYFSLFFSFFFIYISEQLYLIIISSFLVLIVGLIDDAFDLGILLRFLSQFGASVIVIVSGLFVVDIGDYSFFETPNLKLFSIFFTIIAVIGLTNAYNFIDGVDGLCSLNIIITLLSIIAYGYIFSNYSDFNILIILLICLFTFLIFNLGLIKKFKVFLGDGGSTSLGFLIAWLLIYYSQYPLKILNPVLTIWCVSLPICDFICVFIRRIQNKKNPFKPDRKHTHHLLLNLGFKPSMVLIILSILSVLLSLIGGLIFFFFGPTFALLIFIIVIIIYTIISNYLFNLSQKTI